MMADRPGWDEYYLGIAQAISARGECVRRQVGAVIVKDRRIVGHGYNGAPAGRPNCLQGACPRGLSGVAPGSSYDTGSGACIAVHAEANAIIRAEYGDMRDATIYITCPPCDGCSRLINGAGIGRTVWPGGEC